MTEEHITDQQIDWVGSLQLSDDPEEPNFSEKLALLLLLSM